MADPTPGREPLDDRIRATFAAERSDLERRHGGAVSRPARSGRSRVATRWVPIAVAAALVLIAGFVFFDNRSDPTADGIHVATQPGDETDESDTATPAVGDDTSTATAPAPVVTALSGSSPGGAPRPASTGPAAANECPGVSVPSPPMFVWGIDADDPDGGLVAHTDVGVDAPVTGVRPLDDVVYPTGGCRLSGGGTPWFEIAGYTANEWVSSRYLAAPKPACLWGERYGTRTRDGSTPAVSSHRVSEGETLTGIADRYNLTVDALVSANPGSDAFILLGQVLRIPGAGAQTPQQVFGPLDGWALESGNDVAFAAGLPTPTSYRWYPGGGVRVGTPCFFSDATGPICVTGQVLIIDYQSPEPIFSGSGPIELERTGKVYSPPLPDQPEVIYTTPDGLRLTGFLDTEAATVVAGPCGESGTDSFPDDFANRPCAIDEGTPFVSSGRAGSSASAADHIHDIRIAHSTTCTRMVIELGSGAFASDDRPAGLVPVVAVDKDATSTEITFAPCAAAAGCTGFTAGDGERDRVDFADGTVFIAVDEQHQPYVQLLYKQGKASVTLLDNPARIVVDYQRGAVDDRVLTGPIVGDYAILSPAIQSDLYGSVRPANIGFEVRGFARPFEAMGAWFVFAADATGTIGATPTVVQSGDLSTTGWTEGWGQFSVAVPGLPAGYYVVAFGERPPSGDAGFVGSGQLIRIGPNTRTTDPAKPIPAIRITVPLPIAD